MPDFSTLCRRQKTLKVSLPYRGSQGPLHLLIDSTGIRAEGEGEWHARKHGGSKRRVWRKIHLAIDEHTLEVRAIEVTSSDVGDAPCCLDCWTRSLPLSPSPASPPMGLTIPASAMMSSPSVVPMPSYRRAGTPSRGRRTRLERSPATRLCVHQDASAEPSGDDGADTIAEVAPRPRCIA